MLRHVVRRPHPRDLAPLPTGTCVAAATPMRSSHPFTWVALAWLVALPGVASDAGVPEPKSAPPDQPATRGDRIVIDTRARTLTVFAGKVELRRFPISLAVEGVGKVKRGDRRNPVGTYRLMKGRPSKFHRFLPVSYPNEKDAERGLALKLITRAQADAIVSTTREGRMPPQNTALGGAIGVHGIGNAAGFDLGPLQALHRFVNVSLGCFMLTDAEVDELERLYVPGAVLEIR